MIAQWQIDVASAPFAVATNLSGLTVTSVLEAMLDVQYLGGVGRGNTNQYFLTDHWFYGFAKELLTQESIPSIISISFGSEESGACAFKTGSAECKENGWNATQYIYYTNLQYQALGLRGIASTYL
mgnify:CR=1 FL=1